MQEASMVIMPISVFRLEKENERDFTLTFKYILDYDDDDSFRLLCSFRNVFFSLYDKERLLLL